MAATGDDGLRALRDAAEAARSVRVELDDAYLRLLRRVEADPANQSGMDKSWVERAGSVFRAHVSRAKRR